MGMSTCIITGSQGHIHKRVRKKNSTHSESLCTVSASINITMHAAKAIEMLIFSKTSTPCGNELYSPQIGLQN